MPNKTFFARPGALDGGFPDQQSQYNGHLGAHITIGLQICCYTMHMWGRYNIVLVYRAINIYLIYIQVFGAPGYESVPLTFTQTLRREEPANIAQFRIHQILVTIKSLYDQHSSTLLRSPVPHGLLRAIYIYSQNSRYEDYKVYSTYIIQMEF